MTTAAEKVYDTNTAADVVSVNPESLRRAIRLGTLRAKKWGRGYRIKASDLDAWFEGLEDA